MKWKDLSLILMTRETRFSLAKLEFGPSLGTSDDTVNGHSGKGVVVVVGTLLAGLSR